MTAVSPVGFRPNWDEWAAGKDEAFGDNVFVVEGPRRAEIVGRARTLLEGLAKSPWLT